jgi:hypothetical protein
MGIHYTSYNHHATVLEIGCLNGLKPAKKFFCPHDRAPLSKNDCKRSVRRFENIQTYFFDGVFKSNCLSLGSL